MRSFFCIELDPDHRERLGRVIGALKPADARVRWVRPELLHVTLKFLGEITPEQTPALQALAAAAAEGVSPFELVLDTTGAFPNLERPRVVWAGAEAIPDPLATLHARLNGALADWGFKPEREFTPHVTLGRVKHGNPRALSELGRRVEAASFKPLKVRVGRVTLMESVRGRGGPRYQPLFRVGLA